MKAFLEKIHLIDHLSIDLEIPKSEFVSKFQQQVDEGSLSIFSDTFDVFSSSNNEYKGHVDDDGFNIKRKRKFFDMNMNVAIASGTFYEKEEKLIIETEINGFSGIMIPFYVFAIIFYAIFIGVFLVADDIGGNAPGFILPFIIIHGLFMFSIPYFIMKRSTKKMKHELEREFFYMTKN